MCCYQLQAGGPLLESVVKVLCFHVTQMFETKLIVGQQVVCVVWGGAGVYVFMKSACGRRTISSGSM